MLAAEEEAWWRIVVEWLDVCSVTLCGGSIWASLSRSCPLAFLEADVMVADARPVGGVVGFDGIAGWIELEDLFSARPQFRSKVRAIAVQSAMTGMARRLGEEPGRESG